MGAGAGLLPTSRGFSQGPELSRALSFCKASRSRSACEAEAGPITLTSKPVAASMAETFTLRPIAVNSK